MGTRRELIIAIAVVAAAWLVLMIVVARLQRGRETAHIPPLVHYPGTEAVQEQLVPSLGWRKYWFTLDRDYPSTAVYQFYQETLGPKGWRRVGREPTWARKEEEKQVQDLFQATWLSPDEIYQIDLQMVSTVELTRTGEHIASEQRKPGIEVFVTLRRSMGPWLLEPRGKAKQDSPAGAIELKETGR